ncbi:divalent-cation tolerance protein CutA [Deltaproteobacteria bacterium]|nr:divalent-cation tolerance protein CutA [Deltaproteobacteria bacterium]
MLLLFGYSVRYPLIEVMLMTDYIQIFTTTDTKENAQLISRKVVEINLAACAQIIGPITSIFWWKNNINEEKEWLIIIKTRKDLYKELEQTIEKSHKYEVPEILAIPVVAGSKNYLDWLDSEIRT